MPWGRIVFLRNTHRDYIESQLSRKSTFQESRLNQAAYKELHDCSADQLSKRWSTTLSSKVNLPHAINFGALCDANLVTYPADFREVKPLELDRVERAQLPKPGRERKIDF